VKRKIAVAASTAALVLAGLASGTGVAAAQTEHLTYHGPDPDYDTCWVHQAEYRIAGYNIELTCFYNGPGSSLPPGWWFMY
jgi:hypothetical protein